MNKIKSPSIQEYQRLAGIHKRRKIIVISIIVIFESIQTLFEIEWEISFIGVERLLKILQWCDAASFMVIVVLDIYIAILFLNIIQFYVKH